MPHPHPLSGAELEALLRRLPREAPSTGFADQVMARVRLPVVIPVWRRIPWRALVGLAALDLVVAAGLLVWFGDALLHGVGDFLREGAKLVVWIGSLDLGEACRTLAYDAIRSGGTLLTGSASLSTALLIGAAGILLTIATLGRLARHAAPSSR